MWWRCSSQLWLKIRMSSKHTTTNELVNGCKMSSIKSIHQSERHNQPFEKALLGFEGNLPHIEGFDWYLVIS